MDYDRSIIPIDTIIIYYLVHDINTFLLTSILKLNVEIFFFFFNRTANLEKGKDSVKLVSNLLKGELASAVESADNQRERNSRKMQQSRYQKDFRDAMEAFQSVSVVVCLPTEFYRKVELDEFYIPSYSYMQILLFYDHFYYYFIILIYRL